MFNLDLGAVFRLLIQQLDLDEETVTMAGHLAMRFQSSTDKADFMKRALEKALEVDP